jgi:hypothetical protein
MRITRESLLKIGRDTVERRTRADRSLLAVYLCGSLLEEEFLFGGTADIDLVFIHMDSPAFGREIVPLTEEVHLDIAHHAHREYRQTRSLREHPWLGPTINTCTVLYDPQHFLDFIQASVRGQFNRADRVMARASVQAQHARQMWQEFHFDKSEPGPESVIRYLKALDHTANAIASLSGPPITERRYLLNFKQRAENVGRPGLYPGMLGLLGTQNVDQTTLEAWFGAWQRAYPAGPDNQESGYARVNPVRKPYYQSAIQKIMAGPQPAAALWPLLRTWTMAVAELPADAPERLEWQAACQRLGLVGGGFAERVAAFDAYLDTVEEALETWGRENGA